jgi:hypothetical protein
MYYTELLRIRKGLLVFTIVLAVITGFALVTLAANRELPMSLNADATFPLASLFAVSGVLAMLFTFSMCTGLSHENDGHLPVAWTKPSSRTDLALRLMSVDVIGILCAFAITMAFALVIVTAIGAVRWMILTTDTWIELARFILLPLSYFGLVAALTASLGKVGRGLCWAVWGSSWILVILAAVPFPAPWNQIFRFLNYINPIVYSTYSYSSPSDKVQIVGYSAGQAAVNAGLFVDVAALAALFIAGTAAALLQWRRLEA